LFKFQDGGHIKPDSIAALLKKYAGSVKFSNADDGATLLYLLKQDLKGENLIQLIISVLQILNF